MTDTKTLALVAEVERLTKELAVAKATSLSLADAIMDLAAAKQDAENYRALRDSKGGGDYAICIWNDDACEWSALGMPSRDIDARIYEFAAMRRTDAGAKTG